MVQTYLVNEKHADIFKTQASLSQSANITDARFITKDGAVLCQKLFILSTFPFLKDWLCDFCIYSHDEITFLLPEFLEIDIKRALGDIYTEGNVYGLLRCFGFVLKIPEESLKSVYSKEIERNESVDKFETIERSLEENDIVREDLVELMIKEELENTEDEANAITEKNIDGGRTKRWLRNGKRCEDCGI